MTNITPLDFDGNRRESERRLHFRNVAEGDADYNGVGAEFAYARQQAGLDVVQVAQRLRIRREHLLAMEEGRFGDLPAPAYAVGFVRSYADFLGMDSAAAVAQFKLETASASERRPLVFPTAEPADRMPRGWLIGMSLVLAAVVFGAWYYSENQDRFAINRVPPPPVTDAPPVPAGEAAPAPLPEVAVAAPVVPENVPAPPAAPP
ncbi:MAG: helix-turn-helix domain-containing protein, partial [Proteobacteria bacterium]|nr:helix-turn-helix domain-containing protein [Pseudomonadota bacterium]